MGKEIQSNDFLIRVRPSFDKHNDWSGEAEISVITSGDNDLEDDVFDGVELFVKMMLASLPVMEENDYIRQQIHKYVEEKAESFFISNNDNNKQEVIIERDGGNVIKLSFTTATKGEA